MSRISPVDGILAILDDGSFSGTNKYSLLLALIDLAPETTEANPHISFTQLAEKVLELHWSHTRPYVLGERPVVLRQVTAANAQNVVGVKAAQELQRQLPPGQDFESAYHGEHRSLVEASIKRVADALVRNPIVKLQNLPGTPGPFLYEINRSRRGIVLFGEARSDLIRYGSALRQIVESHFVNFILKVNAGSDHSDLYAHLFGAERSMPPIAVRKKLWQLQQGVCFYSSQQLPRPTNTERQSLDHVVPWSRARLSVIENFVLVDNNVNTLKRDLLLDLPLLRKWKLHILSNASALIEAAQASNWASNPDKTQMVLRGLYEASVNPAVFDGAGVKSLSEAERAEAVALLTA